MNLLLVFCSWCEMRKWPSLAALIFTSVVVLVASLLSDAAHHHVADVEDQIGRRNNIDHHLWDYSTAETKLNAEANKQRHTEYGEHSPVSQLSGSALPQQSARLKSDDDTSNKMSTHRFKSFTTGEAESALGFTNHHHSTAEYLFGSIVADDCCLPQYYNKNCTQRIADSPCVPCDLLPDEFVQCEDGSELNLHGNASAKVDGYGCSRYGGERWEDVERTKVRCSVHGAGVECRGLRTFYRYDVPCVKYTGHYFLSTLLYSILLGMFGIDRFCLGHACSGIGKLLTVGGLGLWWAIDVVLICTGNLLPADGSNWERNY